MWRPTMFLLCLIAAMAGSPLRQAEAAGDLARSLAELDGGDVIEEVDGGVGDDSGETILKARMSSALVLPCLSIDVGFAMTFSPRERPTPCSDFSRGAEPPGSFATHPNRRHSWLQCFLF